MIEAISYKRFKIQGGFTLLEIMVSLAVIALVLVSIYRLHAQTIAMNVDARFYATAPFLAQWKISELEDKTGKELVDDSGDFGVDHPGYNWTVKVQEVESEPLGDYAKNLIKIDVAVSLNDTGMSYGVRTYRWADK
jgi:general secretion pathway protein I